MVIVDTTCDKPRRQMRSLFIWLNGVSIATTICVPNPLTCQIDDKSSIYLPSGSG